MENEKDNSHYLTNSVSYSAIYDYTMPVIAVIVILINFVVILSSGLLIKQGVEPVFTYIFLRNLALSDCINGISILLGRYFPKAYRNEYVCYFEIGLIVSSTLSSAYSVALLAIDRFLYIVYGMKYCRFLNIFRVKFIVFLTWIATLLIGFLPLAGWYKDTENGKICWFVTVAPNGLILLTVGIGFVPLLTVLVLYSIILYHAIKKINHIKISINTVSETLSDIDNDNRIDHLRIFKGRIEQTPNLTRPKNYSSTPSQIPKKFKTIKIVVLTTIGFLLTWGPYFFVCILYVYQQCHLDDEREKCQNYKLLISSPLAILGFLNSLINPIIYAWWHNGFRAFVKKKFKKIFKLN